MEMKVSTQLEELLKAFGVNNYLTTNDIYYSAKLIYDQYDNLPDAIKYIRKKYNKKEAMFLTWSLAKIIEYKNRSNENGN